MRLFGLRILGGRLQDLQKRLLNLFILPDGICVVPRIQPLTIVTSAAHSGGLFVGALQHAASVFLPRAALATSEDFLHKITHR